MDSPINQALTLQDLPSEVITNCLQFLNITDLQISRLVSHQFNDCILKSAQIMRKFKFNLQFSIKSDLMDISDDLDASVDLNSSIESDTELRMYGLPGTAPLDHPKVPTLIEDPENLLDLWDFVDSKGTSVRKVELNLNKFDKFSWNFLDQLPNLEELTMNETLSSVEAKTTAGRKVNSLQRLKVLKINMNLLKTFISSTKNVTKLEKLTVFVACADDPEILTNFIAQQRNLSELNLEFDPELPSINFPTSKPKINLKKFKFYNNSVHNQSKHFHKFIESQAGHLTKLKLDFLPDEQLSNIIIKKCRNLIKLELSADSNDELFTNVHEDWKLTALTTFKCDVMENPSFHSMITRFPNVKRLKCGRLGLFVGTYDKVTEIEAELFMSHSYDCKYPNLKALHVKNLLGIKIEDWMDFTVKHKGLENLSISGTFFCDETAFGLEHLKHFENLKTLKFRGIDVDCRMLRNVNELM